MRINGIVAATLCTLLAQGQQQDSSVARLVEKLRSDAP